MWVLVPISNVWWNKKVLIVRCRRVPVHCRFSNNENDTKVYRVFTYIHTPAQSTSDIAADRWYNVLKYRWCQSCGDQYIFGCYMDCLKTIIKCHTCLQIVYKMYKIDFLQYSVTAIHQVCTVYIKVNYCTINEYSPYSTPWKLFSNRRLSLLSDKYKLYWCKASTWKASRNVSLNYNNPFMYGIS